MKRISYFIMAGMLCLPATNANAQSWLNSLGERAVDRAKSSVKNRVENKVDDKVDEQVDNLFNIGKKKPKKNNEEEEQTQSSSKSQSNGWSCDECGKTGNTGKFCAECGAKQGGAAAAAAWACPECGKAGNTGNFCDDCGAKKGGNAAAPAKKVVVTSYSKCDFVPGDEVFYDDNFQNEKLGEFPSMWDLIEGSAEAAKIDDKMCINIEHGAIVEPLMKNQKAYLPDVFTIEFDFFRADEYDMSYRINFLNDKHYDNICIRMHSSGSSLGYFTPSDDFRNADYDWKEGQIAPDAWNHCAISFNKRALKIYINGERIFNIPNVDLSNRIQINTEGWGGFNDSKMNAITNFKMCKGAVPLYDRLATDGKIITYAITFEHGKADLKPESMVEILRIAKLMNEQPGVKFEVQGHCDATGSDKVNDPLSQKRAEAIVAALVEQGIASSRLTAVGKGSHSPLADNSTDEGRAKNRRVEFVKK